MFAYRASWGSRKDMQLSAGYAYDSFLVTLAVRKHRFKSFFCQLIVYLARCIFICTTRPAVSYFLRMV